MRYCALLLVFVAGIGGNVVAQQPGWPPSREHATLLVWPH
jgi:hypothetical protein